MKVILKRDMDSLGLEGDTVNVAKGYARNYLIPKGFALEASAQLPLAWKKSAGRAAASGEPVVVEGVGRRARALRGSGDTSSFGGRGGLHRRHHFRSLPVARATGSA